MNGLRFHVVLLIGLSLGSQANAGMILNEDEWVFRLEFESTDLLSRSVLQHEPLAKRSKPTGQFQLERLRQFRIFDAPADRENGPFFTSPFQLSTMPGMAADPSSLIGVDFQGMELDVSATPSARPTTTPAEPKVPATETTPPRLSDALATIPTPASLTLIGLGLIGLGYRQRRKLEARGRRNRLKVAAAH